MSNFLDPATTRGAVIYEALMGPRALDEVLSYTNDDLLGKFRQTVAVPDDEAREIFTETLKWLWLTATVQTELAITPSMSIIDEMWHQFILMTGPYADFCDRYLGQFVHHHPVSEGERREVDNLELDDKVAFGTDQWIKRAMQHDAVCRLLGDETAHKWDVEYAERYPPATCRKLAIEALFARLAETELAADSRSPNSK